MLTIAVLKGWHVVTMYVNSLRTTVTVLLHMLPFFVQEYLLQDSHFTISLDKLLCAVHPGADQAASQRKRLWGCPWDPFFHCVMREPACHLKCLPVHHQLSFGSLTKVLNLVDIDCEFEINIFREINFYRTRYNYNQTASHNNRGGKTKSKWLMFYLILINRTRPVLIFNQTHSRKMCNEIQTLPLSVSSRSK